ncbi:QWRF motif-containing protein 2-like [Phalaenopsis equestris]|uniref:QWRF motif-containing protein 2-like n=1 Tax=Phalaenopsis equestris TaxID=78828 RepID=UPI0009E4415D|nr:QWRF motif-containing protein 2-like [Phalaenopsis equestris]XP_020575464.1 QWRF motif-containing protein 2-like [Phalaenopsis equestris]
MVVSASEVSVARKNPSPSYRPNDPPPIPLRRPLTPSERDNAAVSRRPKTKEIASRYLSSYSPSSSTTSTSYSSNTTTSTSSSSSSRRFHSPLPNIRPSTPSAKRSQSVDRTRPSSPRPDPRGGGGAEASNAARMLCTTTRSLSVSFQGESFFYQTSKAKTPSPAPTRKPTPERRRPSTPARNSTTGAAQQLESSKPSDFHQRWPAARSRQSSLLTKSLECYAEKNDLLVTVQLLRQSTSFDDGTGRASFDGAELSASSDVDSVSSGSNSGTPKLNAPRQAQITSRAISVASRLWQETNNRVRHLSEPGTPLSSSGPRNSATPKLASVRRTSVDNPSLFSRPASSPLKGPVRPSSPNKLVGSPSRVIASPSRSRGTSTLANSSAAQLPANAPSILSFAAEVRRNRKGENRIEEAHILRLLHNRHLQWRCVNARTNTIMMVQRMDVEKNLYNECITTSEVRDSVTARKIKLQLLSLHLKLATILKGQKVFLEEFSHLDREHSSSLSGAIEALEASTLRLPVVSGARADFQDVKDAVGSAVDVMHAIGASVYTILSKVEGRSSLALELSKIASQEQALLDQSRDLLSTLAALHVKQCSLQGHLLQLKRRTN